MDHFTIFQDFYRVIAEMTEEEIVSAISNGTYRETVEDCLLYTSPSPRDRG